MISKYKRNSKMAALIFIVALLGGFFFDVYTNRIAGDLWEVVLVVSFFYALWAYVKAKGRSAWWTLMGLLGPFGLIVLYVLDDESGESTYSPEPRQRAPT